MRLINKQEHERGRVYTCGEKGRITLPGTFPARKKSFLVGDQRGLRGRRELCLVNPMVKKYRSNHNDLLWGRGKEKRGQETYTKVGSWFQPEGREVESHIKMGKKLVPSRQETGIRRHSPSYMTGAGAHRCGRLLTKPYF